MPKARAHGSIKPDDQALAQEVWLRMSDLVLDNDRRRNIVDAVNLSFGRVRALRRLARKPMSMGELGAALVVDPPNVTTLVDELESLGLVRRLPHPTDRRAKLVEATPAGAKLARRAEAIISTPPPGLAQLPAEDLAALREILERINADHA